MSTSSSSSSSTTTTDYLLLVRKRSGGRLVQFDKSKIENAIYKAMCDTEKGNKELAKSITDKISFLNSNDSSSSSSSSSSSIIDIEDIQDEVERVLMKEVPDVAKAYILYRDEKKKLRKSIASILNVDELDDNSKKNLTVNSAGVFAGRYLLRDLKTGNINETMPQLFDRIAKHIAIVDVMYSDYIFEKNSVYAHKQTIDFNAIIEIYNTYEKEDKNERLNEIYLTHVHRRWSQIKEKIALSFEEFFFCMFTNLESKVVQNDVLALGYNIEELRDAQDVLISLFEERVSVYTKLMSSFRFLPNTPTIMNAGTKNGQLCACFTLDMKDDIRSIFKTISDTAIIFQGAGGVGINFSDIRPLGDLVDNVPNAATGPMSFQSIINFTTDIIKQGGKRKGANMGILNCLSGDTLISTLKGKFPIKDLVGQEPLLYCLDNNNELRIRKADKIIHNGKRNLLRIKFDDDSILECTADHKIMLSDGTFKEAKELKQFDSIMAFYKTSYNKRYHISSTISKNWINEQILVGEYKTGQIIKQNGVNRKPDDLCIHHIDWNQLNNDPLNIEIKTISEHSKMHSKMLNEYQKINTQKRKGKTIEELYGKEKANKIKQKMSKARNDKKPWNKGLKGEQYTNHYNEFKNQFSNHKVISIEYLEGEYDVYDIIMKDYHNFVANGVFVHNCNHPQIAEFITMKLTPGVMENYNVSVGIDKDFWTAFDSKTDYNLINPRNNSVTQKIDAHQLFNLIADTAWKSAEPGVIYFDNVNKHNPLVKIKGQIKITNPCITGNTRLATTKGLIKMKDLYLSGRHLQVITDNRTIEKNNGFGITPRNAVPVFKTSDSEDVWKIETEHGYEIEATGYHKFFVERFDKKIVKRELKNLMTGDKLLIQSDEGEFGNQGSEAIGMILGALESDGHLNESKKQLILQFNGEKKKQSDKLLDMINSVIPKTKSTNNIQNVNIIEVKSRDMQLIQSMRMYEWVKQLNYQKGVVPEIIWQGTKECVIAYLQALFEFDGTVMKNKKSCDVRLSQSNYEFLQQVQLLLSNFGIMCKIHLRRKACEQLMPDGKGGQKLYQRKNSYEIIITGKNRNRFMEKIRFLSNSKNQKVDDFIKNTKSSDKNNYETKIKSITYIGKEAVYDTTVPNNNSIIVSGIVTGQCAEQAMYANNSCTLGSINLAKYVHNKKFDYDSFREDVYETTQFLDNVIDINNYPTPEIEQESLKIRRIGLGYMGLAHALYKMKIPYNSKEGFEFIERISSLLTFHSLEASIKLAVKRGAHGYWDSIMRENSQKNLMDITFDGYTENNLSKYIVTNIEKTLREHGIRNTWTTTIAPTGTISMAADTSNGIEPVYSLVSVKNTSIGKFYYIDKEFKKALKEEGLYSDELLQKVADNHGSCKGLVPKYLEDVFVTSVDIHWIDHIMALASAQKGISNSISKTVNLPKYVTVESFKLAYLLSRYMGIKGLALYRDGSRALQVMDTTSLDNVKNNSLKNPFDKHLKNIGEKGIDKTTVIETSFSDYAMNYILSKVLPRMENPGFVLEALKNSCNLEITEMKINTDLKCPLCESGMIKESHCTRCSICDYSYCM